MRAFQPAMTALLVGLSLTTGAAGAERLGVVLMHGKGGLPAQMATLAAALSAAGHLTETPEMCWSRTRIYAKPYLDCLAEVDTAIERLKARGATAIAVGGQSLGGNAALGYGARHHDLAGVIALAAAHQPERFVRRPAMVKALAQARALIAAGKGDVTTSFADRNTGREFSVQTTPHIYVSFFAADGPAVIPVNAARVTVPLLWIAGTSDATQHGPGYAFAKAKNPENSYVTVAAEHRGTPNASRDAVLAWLKGLGR
jgi:pimeloyl-ACP methyl ester carboxylesterase